MCLCKPVSPFVLRHFKMLRFLFIDLHSYPSMVVSVIHTHTVWKKWKKENAVFLEPVLIFIVLRFSVNIYPPMFWHDSIPLCLSFNHTENTSRFPGKWIPPGIETYGLFSHHRRRRRIWRTEKLSYSNLTGGWTNPWFDIQASNI